MWSINCQQVQWTLTSGLLTRVQNPSACSGLFHGADQRWAEVGSEEGNLGFQNIQVISGFWQVLRKWITLKIKYTVKTSEGLALVISSLWRQSWWDSFCVFGAFWELKGHLLTQVFMHACLHLWIFTLFLPYARHCSSLWATWEQDRQRSWPSKALQR